MFILVHYPSYVTFLDYLCHVSVQTNIGYKFNSIYKPVHDYTKLGLEILRIK